MKIRSICGEEEKIEGVEDIDRREGRGWMMVMMMPKRTKYPSNTPTNKTHIPPQKYHI